MKKTKTKKNLKKKIFCIIAIIAIVMIIVTVIKLGQKKKVYKEEIERKYFVVNENEKYGVIDKNGEVIIKAEYDALQIPNPSKPIFICLSDYNSTTAEYNSKVLNDKAEQIFKEYANVSAIEVKDMTASYLYKTSLLKYKKDGKYGLIDINGKKITDAEYDSITNLEYKNEELLVAKDGKYGVLKNNGKELIKCEYSSITADKYYNKESKYMDAGFIVCQKNEAGYRYGYINNKGKIILQPEYSELTRITDIAESEKQAVYLIANKNAKKGLLKNKKQILNFEYDNIEYNYIDNVLSVEKNHKVGVVNLKGKEILKIEFDDITFLGIYINTQKDGENEIYNAKGEKVENSGYTSLLGTEDKKYYITLDENNLYGVMDKEEKQIIPNNYNYIGYVFEDLFIVSKDNKFGIINKEGKSVIDIKYDVIEKLETADIIKASLTEESKIDLFSKEMKPLASLKDSYIEEKEKYVKFYNLNEVKYFTLAGNEISNSELFSKNSIVAVNENGKWGFKSGNTKIVECVYDRVTELNEYGFAGIMKDGKWGVVNKEGKVIIQPVYQIDTAEPEFIGKYYRVYYGYGQPYYTSREQQSDLM